MNLYAWRATDPKGLLTATDPIGEDNDAAIRFARDRATIVIAAWGALRPEQKARGREVLELLRQTDPDDEAAKAQRTVHALGWTKDGDPRHPLYLPAITAPRPYF